LSPLRILNKGEAEQTVAATQIQFVGGILAGRLNGANGDPR